MVADGRRVFRDLEEGLLTKLYGKSIRYSVMELPFFSWIDGMPDVAREPVQGVASACVYKCFYLLFLGTGNAKVIQ